MTSGAPPRGGNGPESGSVSRPPRRSRPSNRSPLQFPEVLTRAKAFFRERATVEGVVARRILDDMAPDDPDLADHLIRERRRRSRMDGSIGGSLQRTARAVWDMMELGAPKDHAAIVRMTGYILTRANQPGRWSDDGAAGDGFFSPGPRGERIAPLELASRTVFDDDEDARFVASCLALRAVLRAGHDDREGVRQHLEGLLAIRAIDNHLAFVALGALGLAEPAYVERVGGLVDEVTRQQAEDGSWPIVTVFHAVDMLLSVPTAAARTCIRRAAPLIASLQRDNGAFDDTNSEHVALIAVRALDSARTLA